MADYRLLAIDIDGTLVNSRDELTPATREALALAQAAGIHVVLATGRRYRRVLHLVEPLAIEVPLITASGALVKEPLHHRTLFRAEVDRKTLLELMKIVVDQGYEPVLNGDTFHEGFDFYYPHDDVDSDELAEYLQVNPGRGRIWPRLTCSPPPGIYAGFAMGSREAMIDLEQVLQSEMPGRLATHVLRSPRYAGFMCEFTSAGVSKWSAITRLAAQWNIDAEEICAVGDDVNDLTMIQSAGLGIAMGNAQPVIQAAADRIAPSHDEDGLVRVVQWILEG